MEYHLQNVRTGETLSLQPQRTLIGTAKHATIRTSEGSPYLAALAVRYPTGWAVHGLSHDHKVTFNRKPLRVAQQFAMKKSDLLVIGEDRFTVVSPRSESAVSAIPANAPPTCFAYIRNPDGMEECRTVDHDLLFGRLTGCHVQLSDSRLSRLSALLASHGGEWYIHSLSEKPLGRNRQAVQNFSQVEDGDELIIGPLVVRIEFQTVSESSASDFPSDTETEGTPESSKGQESDLVAMHQAGFLLEQWLKKQTPVAVQTAGGISGWLEAQRDRLKRFWFDTPETTAARSLSAAGRPNDAFAILDRAIRARPESPQLLRELYRLYEAVGLIDLCHRPLRQIEKLAIARGTADAWVLETLARLCERLGKSQPGMFDRAIAYWNKLEALTGVSHARERAAALAIRTIREGGYEKTDHDA
jgi:tetratricopeptide (TPR) repeat protein